MNNRLNIYACSGIGATGDSNILNRLVYETEGSNTLDNTVAMNMLLSQINYRRAKYLYGAQHERTQAIADLDLYAVCYWFARKYRDDAKELERIGVNIGLAVAGGDFDCQSDSLEDHEELVEKLIDKIENETGSDENADAAFVAWWDEYVVDMSRDAATTEEKKVWNDAVSGIGALDKYGIDSESDLSKYLNDSGSYFTYYICLTLDEAIRMNATIAEKWRKQKEVYDYCYNCFVGFYGTEESLLRIIETGIMETYGRSLEDCHDQILSGEAFVVDKVGELTMALVAIISAILSFIMALIESLIDYGKTVVKYKYTVPDDTDSAILSEDDYTGSVTTASMSMAPILLIGGIAAVAALFGKKL